MDSTAVPRCFAMGGRWEKIAQQEEKSGLMVVCVILNGPYSMEGNALMYLDIWIDASGYCGLLDITLPEFRYMLFLESLSRKGS